MRPFLKTAYQQDWRLFPYGGERRFFAGLGLFALLLAAHEALPPVWGQTLLLIYAAGLAALLLRRDRRGEGGGGVFWYGLLALLLMAAPLLADAYLLSQITFILVFAIAGIGLIVLSGRAGQISLGHAAFMACGAYVQALLVGVGFGILVSLPAAVLFSAAMGLIIGLPSLRMRGIYLAFATYAFAFIVEEILIRWESVTGGSRGLQVEAPPLIGALNWRFESESAFYYLTLALFALTLLAALNLLRSPTGRAFAAVRDSEIAAQSMGINVGAVKLTAFAVSAGMAGLAGALYAHLLFVITPESFTIILSIQLLMMIIVGGIAALHGAVFGAVFLVMIRELPAEANAWLPDALAVQSGLEAGIFGLIIILFILFEPLGVHGRWVKIRTWFDLFPLYRKGAFRRQRRIMASERNQ